MMASSSSSSSSSSNANMIPETKYDVFLSFRGEDIRDNFISHLYAALCREHIDTFIDNQIIKGDEISQSLLNAIEKSSISVIIFSKHYASSGWCLDELVKIIECKNKYGQIVIPVFYHVSPSDVRNQIGDFGNSFSKLAERFKERIEKLQTWSSALTEAANLSGFASHVTRPEYELIKKIVNDILKRLSHMFSSDYKDQLIGIESSINEIELLLLNVGLKDIYILGIWGIGGIGKTTIANAIFNKISNYFEGSCFMQNVREEIENTGGFSHLQQKLICTLLNDENLKISISNIGFNLRRLSRKKVLIVFDDVTQYEQIESLIGRLTNFGIGSRIMITTRDKQVLKICRVDEIYKVNELVHDNALKLFSRHAFGHDLPSVGYNELSNEVIKYAQGVPLALKVFGCFLFGRSKEEWESAINKLKRMLHMDVQKVLKVSFDGLDDKEQSIFLDIACFFKGEDKELIVKVLDACGYFAEIGISTLVDKCLISILDNKITMHDLLQEMGREIVRQESISNPGKRSRLWHHEDIYKVLTYSMGTETIEGICLDMSKVGYMHLNSHTFTNMHHLRIIKFYNSLYGDNINKLHPFGELELISKELRYLHWQGYPMKSLPSVIHPENLVSLEMCQSNIEQLWNSIQNLASLKQIDLGHSKQLRKLPDLSLAQNLEKLSFKNCSSLVEVHSSIQYLNKIAILDLSYCKRVRSLPSIHSESLQMLYLSGCSNLKKFPEISSSQLERLFLDGTAIEALPSSINRLSRLVTLNLQNCLRLEQLPESICKLKSLRDLSVSGCSNLQKLPDELGNLEALKRLNAKRIAAREVPASIASLNNLRELSFERFRGHEKMGFLLPISLSLGGFHSLTFVRLIDCGITELPESLGQLSSLQKLFLQKNNFERIPESIIQLSNLSRVSLSYCKKLKSLPKLPCHLKNIDATHCTSLKALSGLSILFTLTSKSDYQLFDLSNCFKLDRNELREILEDAQRKIQLIATALWKTRDEKHHQQYRGTVSFPGGEIPKWFKMQSVGSSVALKLPPGWFNNKFVGFAFCAVVAFLDHRRHHLENSQSFLVAYEFKLKTEHGGWRVAFGDILFLGNIIGDDNGVTDHVYLTYNFPGKYFDGVEESYFNSDNEALIQFYVKHLFGGKLMESCEVTKCGIRLFYAQDFRESAEYSSYRSYSTGHEEVESSRKRLKH